MRWRSLVAARSCRISTLRDLFGIRSDCDPLRTSKGVRHCSAALLSEDALVSQKNWGALGCAAFFGAVVAFPAGVIFGGRNASNQQDRPGAQRENAGVKPNFRKFYSPNIHSDPYVQGQWQKVVEELEAQCRNTGQHCTEAKAARNSLAEKW